LLYQQLADAADDSSIASKFRFYKLAPHQTEDAIRQARERGEIDPETGTVRIDKRNYYRRIICSVDTATKANERANYTVAQIWAETFDRKHYLLDQIRGKWAFPEMTREVNKLARKHNADKIIIEDKGNGTSYIQEQGGTEFQRRKAPAPVEAIQVPSNQSKEFRFDEITPIIEAGEVYLPEDAPWVDLFVNEVGQFPEGSNDDQVDTLAQYLRWSKTKRRKFGTAKITKHG
jgi:predicted phage terminase large subunit-like protein